MMPNALKLEESVRETALEVSRTEGVYDLVLLPASSGTIAAGVIRGFLARPGPAPSFVVHLGYSRPTGAVLGYISKAAGIGGVPGKFAASMLEVIDEKYAYSDVASAGPTPPWPCNQYYDLKTFRWWLRERGSYDRYTSVLLWNIG